MSYTGTLAQSGLGTIFAINTSATSTPTWVTIGEIINAPQSGRVAKTADATNLESLAAEFITTLVDSGNFELTVNRVVGDPGQLAVETAFEALATKPFQITLPLAVSQTTTGDVYSFKAVIEEFDNISEIAPDKAIHSKIRLKVSGKITFAAGS
jgi:hypothetical protein